MHPFISTRPVFDGRSRAFAFSVVAHVVFFAAIITARVTTASSGGELARAANVTERLRFIEVAPAPAEPVRAPAPPAPHTHAKPAAKPIPSIKAFTFEVPNVPSAADAPGISTPLPPDLDFTAKVSDSTDFGPVKTSSILGDGGGFAAGVTTPANGIYTVDMVERVVMPFPDNPKPVYPSSLLSAGVEGTFVVHFVVDANGRVDEKSMEFPNSAHRLFVDAVRRALKRSRYRPAEVAGKRVAQLVEQQFTFRIQR